MFTRCPKCQTVHPLNAKLISHARGLVQCGECGRTFSSLSFLFDEWPSGEPNSPAKGSDSLPPIVGIAKKTPKSLQESDVLESEDDGTEASTSKPHRLAWGVMTGLLIMVTFANVAWTFRDPIMENPTVYSWLKQNGLLQPEQKGLLKAPEQIQLISRDMHSHPTRSGILILSLTFVNLAERPQYYPLVEITLLDASNQPLARRRFQPKDYLRSNANIGSGMATDVFLPVLLELGDPGEQAVGFEIQFL